MARPMARRTWPDASPPTVQVHADGQRQGVAARRNQIVDLARTELLASSFDADDLMHPERLARQVAALRTPTRYRRRQHAAYTIDAANRILGVRGDGPLVVSPARVLRPGIVSQPHGDGPHRLVPAAPLSIRRSTLRKIATCGSARAARPALARCKPLLFYREGQTVNLANYLEGNRTLRYIIDQSGADVVHWRSRWLGWKLALKNGLYGSATVLGLQARLVLQRRNRLPQGGEHAAAKGAGTDHAHAGARFGRGTPAGPCLPWWR